MNNQTPRQQLEAIPVVVKLPSGKTMHLTTNRLAERSVDAILAIFKGLPAMREEELTAFEADGHGYYKVTRNELRRQILAELEGE